MNRKKIFFAMILVMLIAPITVVAATIGNPDLNPNVIKINNISCPTIGSKPSYLENSNYITIKDELWINVTDYKEMQPTDTFETGKEYQYRLLYDLKEEDKDKIVYLDFRKCQYSLGGGGADVDYLKISENTFYMGSSNEYKWQEKENVTLDIDEPIKDEYPPYAKNSNKYVINEQKWFNETDNKQMTSNDVFESNKKYSYEITLTTFYNTKLLLNSFKNSIYYLGHSQVVTTGLNQYNIKGTFYFGDKDDLKLEGPLTIENASIPENDKLISFPNVIFEEPTFSINSYWNVMDSNNPMGNSIYFQNGEKFQKGKEYEYHLTVYAEPGYSFADNFEVINNNKNSSFINESVNIYESQICYNELECVPINVLNYSSKYRLNEEGEKIGISGSTTLMYPNYNRQFTVYPNNEDNQEITWTSSNENIAYVNAGLVIALAPGDVTITATNKNGASASINLTIGVPVEKIILDKTNITLYEGDEIELSASVLPDNATNKAVYFSPYFEEGMDYNNLPISLGGEFGQLLKAIKPGTIKVEARTSTGGYAICEVTVLEKPKKPSTSYKTHVQSYGWQEYVKDGTVSGTSGEAKRLEAIQIKLDNQDYDGDIEYRTHIQSYGWETTWKKNDQMSGTSGEAKRLEAIQIKLTGEMADHYDIYYRVHAQKFGWLGWAKNGESAGTASFAYRLEAIQIMLVDKNESFEEYGEAQAFVDKHILYTTHVQTYGWQEYAYDGKMSGTSGEAKRLEAIKIMLNNQEYDGDVEYQTHIQTYGWETTWKKNNEISGTSGEAKRLEAIRIRLTGEMADHFDIYYRVHAQSYGWLGWAKNGEEAGTAGLAKRLEGIEIVVVNKGQLPPERDNQRDTRSYIEE